METYSRGWSTARKSNLQLSVILLTLVAVFFTAQLAQAQSLREKLSEAIEAASGNQLRILSITPTPLSTIFEVELSTGEVLYSDISGDFMFAGDMFQTSPAGLLNLTGAKKQERALEKVAAVPESEMIIFSPEDEVKSSITVFTDVDCTYCRKLHGDLEQLLAKGIEIRYLAYPRGGAQAASYDKMLSVWCSQDRKRALTQAKNGQNLPTADCITPVLAHYGIGNQLGISGTPALVLPDGRVVPGYMDAERLGELLGVN